MVNDQVQSVYIYIYLISVIITIDITIIIISNFIIIIIIILIYIYNVDSSGGICGALLMQPGEVTTKMTLVRYGHFLDSMIDEMF